MQFENNIHEETAQEQISYIAENLSKGEILAQLAEESAELTQAALKHRRTFTEGASPTPKTEDETLDNLIEEFADVLICAEAINHQETKLFGKPFTNIYKYKLRRWYDRIKEART